MKIGSSEVALASKRLAVSGSLLEKVSYCGLSSEAQSLDAEEGDSAFDRLKSAVMQQEGANRVVTKDEPRRSSVATSLLELRMRLLEQIREMLEHRKQCCKVQLDPLSQFLQERYGITPQSVRDHTAMLNGRPVDGSVVATGAWYIKQEATREIYTETENTNFLGRGTIITEDGREIDFGIEIELSRAYTEKYESYSEQQYMLCDPLVINYKGNALDITDQKFSFDLDADGKVEEISSLGEGSAFLALDLNGDGKINDGSELFGTRSGNGFADLAAYDDDGNGWIDENDAVFDKLKLWSGSSLGSIRDAGLGAIYLESVRSEFSKKNAFDNATQAIVRKSGVYLMEDGSAGSIMHVDFAT